MLAVIQARFSSKRLPGKVLMKLDNQTILEHAIRRVKKSDKISSVIVATSNDISDDPVANLAKNSKVEVNRGDLYDLVNRLLGAAQSQGSKYFLRISADSPFIDSDIIDQAVSICSISNPDLVTNIFPRTFPKGQSVEIIKTEALERVSQLAGTSEQVEHVTPYFYENYQEFQIVNFTSGQNSSDSIQCIDTPVDFEIASQVVQQTGTEDVTWQELETLFSKAQNQK